MCLADSGSFQTGSVTQGPKLEGLCAAVRRVGLKGVSSVGLFSTRCLSSPVGRTRGCSRNGAGVGGGRDSEALTAAATATAARGGDHGEVRRELRVTELTLTSASEEAVVSGGDQGIRGGLFKFIDELNNPNHHTTSSSHAALPLGLVLLHVNEVRAAPARLAPLSSAQPYSEEAPSAPRSASRMDVGVAMWVWVPVSTSCGSPRPTCP